MLQASRGPLASPPEDLVFGMITLALVLGSGPQQTAALAQEAGRECTFEGIGKDVFSTSGDDVPDLAVAVKMTQIVLGEKQDGARDLVRVIVATPKDGKRESDVKLFSVSPAHETKAAVMAMVSFGTRVPEIPEVLEPPLDLDQLEQGDPIETSGHLNGWFGFASRPVKYTIEEVGAERCRVHRAPASGVPFRITGMGEDQQVIRYEEWFDVDRAQRRTVGYHLAWQLKSEQGVQMSALDLKETASRTLPADELLRRCEEAAAIKEIQQATQENPAKAKELLQKLEARALQSPLADGLPGLRTQIDRMQEYVDQQKHEAEQVAKLVNHRAPDFTLEDLDGRDVTLSQHAHGKVVLLSFWGFG